MDPRILFVAEEGALRQRLSQILRCPGFECEVVGNEAGRARTPAPALVLYATERATADGFAGFDRFRAAYPAVPTLLCDGAPSLEGAREAFRRGACDYLGGDATGEEILASCRRALASAQRNGHGAAPPQPMIGKSAAMNEVHRLIACAASTDGNVLITGESGTGKELVARAIHAASAIADGPLVAVNCAGLPEPLLEGELFGHLKGAYTGAHCDRLGYFEAAAGGTLFLDEISSMPLTLQAKLLRAVERHEVVRLGDTHPKRVHVRLVAASNRDLHVECAHGRFREDLYYRLRVIDIALPPLRSRKEDIPALIEHVVARCNRSRRRAVLGVDAGALRILMAHAWPGNVRELENTVERAMAVTQSDWVRPEDLPREVRGPADTDDGSEDLRQSVANYEVAHILHVLAAARGNREAAARRLGIDPSTLYRKLARHRPAESAHVVPEEMLPATPQTSLRPS